MNIKGVVSCEEFVDTDQTMWFHNPEGLGARDDDRLNIYVKYWNEKSVH